ncbi:VOC family protein [Steroidobacter flavus]|uniref:VOC family protein n=1 Tax=Steroidobacter flavus TaxID=1842136 RepID=A0ABV8SVZ2_9GAMM
MFGRFLEISVHAPEIRDSLAFYESLGFVQAPVGETFPHPYAVVTDGRLFLGLHGRALPSPALTFVMPRLMHGIEQLEQLGIELEDLQLGNEVFNRVSFRDPSGQYVNVFEARTFSPPQFESHPATTCGYFTEYGLPAREQGAMRVFWEALGFVAWDEQSEPFARTAITSDHLNLSLYRSRAFRQPVLTFEDPDMRERLARLKERGLQLSDEMPDSLDESCNAILIAPEGTRLLLIQSED